MHDAQAGQQQRDVRVGSLGSARRDRQRLLAEGAHHLRRVEPADAVAAQELGRLALGESARGGTGHPFHHVPEPRLVGGRRESEQMRGAPI